MIKSFFYSFCFVIVKVIFCNCVNVLCSCSCVLIFNWILCNVLFIVEFVLMLLLYKLMIRFVMFIICVVWRGLEIFFFIYFKIGSSDWLLWLVSVFWSFFFWLIFFMIVVIIFVLFMCNVAFRAFSYLNCFNIRSCAVKCICCWWSICVVFVVVLEFWFWIKYC